MIRTLAARALRRMGARYDYDVAYLLFLLDASPKGFFKFAKLFDLARHREVAPTAAVHAAKLVGALVEDCGPCVQLVVNMAVEAKVPATDIAAVLRRDANAMSAEAALGFRFAEAVAYKLASEEEAREAVRAAWGDRGVIDLALALMTGRLFPIAKAGMGYASVCRRVTVGGDGVDVVKRAA